MGTRESNSRAGSPSEFNTESHTEPSEESEGVMRVRVLKRHTETPIEGLKEDNKKEVSERKRGTIWVKTKRKYKNKEKVFVCMLPRRLEEKVKMVYYGEDQGQ